MKVSRKIIVIICGVILLVSAIVLQLNQANEAASIGIIGGADGPTAIYLAGPTVNYMRMIVVGIIVLVVIFIGLMIKKKFKK